MFGRKVRSEGAVGQDAYLSGYQVTQSGLNAAGTPVSDVTTDIEGKARDLTNPDIGAYEFDLMAMDAGIDTIIPPPFPYCFLH